MCLAQEEPPVEARRRHAALRQALLFRGEYVLRRATPAEDERQTYISSEV